MVEPSGTSHVETRPHTRLERLLEALSGTTLPTLPGATVKRSKFTTRQLARDNPLRGKVRRKKYKSRRDSFLRKKRIRQARYREETLLDRDRCYGFYRTKYRDRWDITKDEWDKIWEEYGLDGVSPVVSPIRKGVRMDKYGIVIKPKQERKLRTAIYDGDDVKLYDISTI